MNAFHFDQKEFSLSYHHKLTMNHFELDPASKMRNHLAEDVLDKNMLNLMKVFLSHLINIIMHKARPYIQVLFVTLYR